MSDLSRNELYGVLYFVQDLHKIERLFLIFMFDKFARKATTNNVNYYFFFFLDEPLHSRRSL